MATFLEEIRKCFRFVGYGEAGEKLTITGQDGAVIRMLSFVEVRFETEFSGDLRRVPQAHDWTFWI